MEELASVTGDIQPVGSCLTTYPHLSIPGSRCRHVAGGLVTGWPPGTVILGPTTVTLLSSLADSIILVPASGTLTVTLVPRGTGTIGLVPALDTLTITPVPRSTVTTGHDDG